MPIASYKPTTPSVKLPETPKIQPDDYKSTVIDENKTPLNSLLSYIQGAPWTVTYYSQIVNKSQDIKDHDVNQSAVYQSYTKIINLELRVSDPLSSQQDDTALTSVTGTAIVYPFLRPNVGDVFIAASGSSKSAYFRVTNTEARSFNLEAVFTIEYQMVAYIDEADERWIDLESKAVRTYVFDKNRLTQGLQPMIIEGDYHTELTLKDAYYHMLKQYFKMFYNKSTSTIALPGQGYLMYDPYLTYFISRVVEFGDAPEIPFMKVLSIDNVDAIDQKTIWTLLLERSNRYLPYVNRKMGLIDKRQFGNNVFIDSIRFHKVDFIVYPIEVDIPEAATVLPNKLVALIDLKDVKSSAASMLDSIAIKATGTKTLIYKITEDSSYVLTDNFYLKTPLQSQLEVLVQEYLNQEAIALQTLKELVDAYPSWGKLEQFYYMPILMVLLKAAVSGIY